MNPQPPNTTFTPGWSSYQNIVNRAKDWQKHVVPSLVGKPVKWLELGSYEGRSALWTLDNILTHPDSSITCVDIFKGEYEATFDANIATHSRAKSVHKIKRDCFSTLAELAYYDFKFDGIYVDADHQAKAALTEAAMCWPLLKKGGFLIFDDYPWQHKTPEDQKTKLPPKPGIDAFLECWQYELRLLHKEWQVIVQKI